jgi:RNA polymerase sigma-70 factor (ECF subfamily)
MESREGRMSNPLTQGHPTFPTTHWSEVIGAGQWDSIGGLAVLNRLILRYQGALKAHLIHKYRLSDPDAADVLQSFTAEKILKSNLLSFADVARGRFRTFLLTALDRFYLNMVRQAQASKRFPEGGHVPLSDLEPTEITTKDPLPGLSFDLAWAMEVMERVQQQMHDECLEHRREDIWEVFAGRILSPFLEKVPEVSYEELVKRFGLRSPEQASNVLITGKRMFLRHLHAVLGEYCRDEKAVAEEIEDFKAILSQS